MMLFLEFIQTNRDTTEPTTPSRLEATKSMCKLAGNDPATIIGPRPEVPGATVSEGCLRWKLHLTLKGPWHR